jgi:hypothetical protein
LAWIGAVVLRTYFLVAQPPASRAPVTMNVVAKKAFIVQNLATNLAIQQPFILTRSFSDDDAILRGEVSTPGM